MGLCPQKRAGSVNVTRAIRVFATVHHRDPTPPAWNKHRPLKKERRGFEQKEAKVTKGEFVWGSARKKGPGPLTSHAQSGSLPLSITETQPHLPGTSSAPYRRGEE